MEILCVGITLDRETFPFICPECKVNLECDVIFNGQCICQDCETDFYNKLVEKCSDE